MNLKSNVTLQADIAVLMGFVIEPSGTVVVGNGNAVGAQVAFSGWGDQIG